MPGYLDTFKTLADRTSSGIAAFVHDEYQVCAHLGIPTDNGYSRRWVTDKFDELIKAAMETGTSTPTLDRKILNEVLEGLVFDAVLNDHDNSTYLTLYRSVTSRVASPRLFSDEAAWHSALTLSRELEDFDPHVHTVQADNLRQTYPRLVDIAQAAKLLRGMGCTIDLNDTLLEIKKGLEDVAASIEDSIRKMGAEVFLEAVFRHLAAEGKYYAVYKRFIITNEISMLPQQTQPMIPYGYLINLAVKHPVAPRAVMAPNRTNALMDDIVHKSKLLAAVSDIRHYGIWERHFQTVEDLPDFVIKLALFDSAFSFPSYDLEEIIDQLLHLFTWVDDVIFESRHGFKILEYLQVTKAVALLAPEIGPGLIYASSVKKHSVGLSKEKVQHILQQMAHAPGKANKGYAFFTDYDLLDFGFKPLLELSDTKFLLCDRSWCAMAFYEVMAAKVRGLDMAEEESNSKLGFALEAYIYTKLQEKDITFSHGNYADGQQSKGEADVLITSTQSITLIENKKKVLTRRSKTGSDVQLIIDLAASLLEAHIQTGRSELLLRKQGFIELTLNEKTERIEWQDREIERIALTHWDYGSFQDRDVINRILSILLTAEIGLLHEPAQKDIDAFNNIRKKQKKFEKQALELQKLDPSFNHYPFFNCWFLSLSQLLTIIRYSVGNQEFHQVLHSTRHISFGTANFYKEFYFSYIKQREKIE